MLAVEEVFGEWVPSAEEERFRELYAASAGGSAEEVLARMRANGQGIINDAAAPATQTGGSGGGAGKPPKREPAGDAHQPPHMSDKVRDHILYGDSHGGGHKYGVVPQKPNSKKRWFPEGWTDEQIIDAVLLVARRPAFEEQKSDRLLRYGEVGGVRIKVWVGITHREITAAHPMDGEGVVQIAVGNDHSKVTILPIAYGRGGVSW